MNANNNLLKNDVCFEFFKPCYASAVSVDDDGNFIEEIPMKPVETRSLVDCANHVKKWLADLCEEGFCISNSATSWGAPLGK